MLLCVHHSAVDTIWPQNVIQKTNKLIMRSQNQYMKKDFKRIIKKLDILIKKVRLIGMKRIGICIWWFQTSWAGCIKSKSCLTRGFWPALWNIRPCARGSSSAGMASEIVWWRSEQAWAFCNLYKHNYWHRQITFKFKTGIICSSLSGSIVYTHREFSNRCHLIKLKCFSFWSLN